VAGREDDLYEVLGVSRDADAEDLRRAYRRALRRLHPDTRTDERADEEALDRVLHAYRVLSDPAGRARHDARRAPDPPPRRPPRRRRRGGSVLVVRIGPLRIDL
jgi:molecular chaperone DnaJ